MDAAPKQPRKFDLRTLFLWVAVAAVFAAFVRKGPVRSQDVISSYLVLYCCIVATNLTLHYFIRPRTNRFAWALLAIFSGGVVANGIVRFFGY